MAISLFALPRGEEREDIGLALGQCRAGASGARTSRMRRAAACGESCTWPAAAALIARQQLVRLRVLEQVADGAGLDRADDGAVLEHAGEGDDLRVGQLLADRAGRRRCRP